MGTADQRRAMLLLTALLHTALTRTARLHKALLRAELLRPAALLALLLLGPLPLCSCSSASRARPGEADTLQPLSSSAIPWHLQGPLRVFSRLFRAETRSRRAEHLHNSLIRRSRQDRQRVWRGGESEGTERPPRERERGGRGGLWGGNEREEGERLWGGDRRVHTVPSPEFYAAHRTLRALKHRVPCQSRKHVIPVFSYDDILKRADYPADVTVTLVFQRSIALPKPIVLFSNFSCSLLVPAKRRRVVLSTTWSNAPALAVAGASNILISGLSIRFGIRHTSSGCKWALFREGVDFSTLTCPAVYVTRSFGVQLAKGGVYGRIDVFRSMFVKLDSLKVTMPPYSYNTGAPYKGFNTLGVIRIGETSLGSTFTDSGIVVSNCEVYGHWERITLYRGAVGITIRNNYLHDFLFTAIRCGWGDSYVMDCNHNYIGYNYITNPSSYTNSTSDGDNAGIYAASHWFNPGNLAQCNYVFNQRHCIYLDEESTGFTVDGGVCYNSNVGVKLNNGKSNKISSLVVANAQDLLSYIHCYWTPIVNYPNNKKVRGWEDMRRAYYNTPAVNQAYPFMKSICNPVPSSIGGIPCNTPGGWTPSQTGKCSGVPYDNHVETFAVNPPNVNNPAAAMYCNKLPSVLSLNEHLWFNVTDQDYTSSFNNIKRFDFGVQEGSPLFTLRPNFKSCPRTEVGPKRVFFTSYIQDFNIKEPDQYKDVLAFNFDAIL